MLRNCFLDFAVDHWFGCCTTEPGFAGDIGTIEVSLIDTWLFVVKLSKSYPPTHVYSFSKDNQNSCLISWIFNKDEMGVKWVKCQVNHRNTENMGSVFKTYMLHYFQAWDTCMIVYCLMSLLPLKVGRGLKREVRQSICPNLCLSCPTFICHT